MSAQRSLEEQYARARAGNQVPNTYCMVSNLVYPNVQHITAELASHYLKRLYESLHRHELHFQWSEIKSPDHGQLFLIMLPSDTQRLPPDNYMWDKAENVSVVTAKDGSRVQMNCSSGGRMTGNRDYGVTKWRMHFLSPKPAKTGMQLQLLHYVHIPLDRKTGLPDLTQVVPLGSNPNRPIQPAPVRPMVGSNGMPPVFDHRQLMQRQQQQMEMQAAASELQRQLQANGRPPLAGVPQVQGTPQLPAILPGGGNMPYGHIDGLAAQQYNAMQRSNGSAPQGQMKILKMPTWRPRDVPVEPKPDHIEKPSTPYNAYIKEHWVEIRKANPGITFNLTEQGQIAGKNWKALPEEERQRRQDIYNDLKTEHGKRMDDFRRSEVYQRYRLEKRQAEEERKNYDKEVAMVEMQNKQLEMRNQLATQRNAFMMEHGFRGGSHKNTPRAGNEKVLEVEATRRGRGDDADDLVTMAATRMIKQRRIMGDVVGVGSEGLTASPPTSAGGSVNKLTMAAVLAKWGNDEEKGPLVGNGSDNDDDDGDGDDGDGGDEGGLTEQEDNSPINLLCL